MKKQNNGTGTFYERPDKTIQYRVSVGIDASGKAIRKSFYGHSKKECTDKYKEWLKNGQNTPIERVKTVSQWADKWLELYKKDKVAYGTYRNYKLYVDKHIKPTIGSLRFEQVRPAHIAALFKKEASLSQSARHHIYVALKGIFDTAVENHFCKENPVRSPGKSTLEDDIKIRVFTLEQIQFILNSDHPNAIYSKLLLYTGLRMGELLALKWTDIDCDQQIITVKKSIARAENGGFEEKSTKSGKTRYVGITPKLNELLKTIPKRGFYVLADKVGNHLTPHQFEHLYQKFFKDTNAFYLSPHKCRHTYATYLIKGGAELRSVQELLGHSKSEVTELYTHVDTEDIVNNVSKLGY